MSDIPEFTQSYTTQDKSTWGDGPWQDEIDKAVWVDQDTDLDCMIVRNHGGALCGYVGVPEGHPLFGQHYEEPDVEVHGGLTFADGCHEDGDEATAICHIPLPGRSDKVWWFGFDTAHCWDFSPAMQARLVESFRGSPLPSFAQRDRHEVYRDVPYVVRQIQGLAKQLAEVEA